MKSLLSFMLGILCLPLFTGCDQAANASQEDFTPKWSALAAAQMLKAGPVTPDVPVKPGICSNCNGKGKVGDGTIMVTCAVCGGDGKVGSVQPAISLVSVERCSNPLCKCENCKGKDCTCAVDEKSVAADVTSPLVDIRRGIATPEVDEKRFTAPQASPPPGLFIPVSNTVAKKAAPAATAGHWEQRHYGRRGQFVESVWVPASGSAVCANGSCATGQCANGQCSPASAPSFSGGCASCGRGRR